MTRRFPPQKHRHTAQLTAWTALAAVISIFFGGDLEDIKQIFDKDYWTSYSYIIYEIRLPRTMLAIFSGGALALAGTLSQALFRNPLASPSVVGTQAGASLGVTLAFFTGTAWSNVYAVPVFAIFSAVATTFLVIKLFSLSRSNDITLLLLVGFATSSLLAGVSSLVISVFLSDPEKALPAIRWMYGSFSGADWRKILLVVMALLPIFTISLKRARDLDIISLGEKLAGSLAIDVQRLRRQSIWGIGLLVGTTASVSGGLPFVGLIVPHIMRGIVGPGHRMLIPASVIGGALLALICDLLARTLRYPQEMEVGTLTSVLGAAFFIHMIFSQTSNRKKVHKSTGRAG